MVSKQPLIQQEVDNNNKKTWLETVRYHLKIYNLTEEIAVNCPGMEIEDSYS